MTRVKNMGKNIKSYATTQVHFPGKGREALRQKVLNLSFKIRYGLTVHIIRFLKFLQAESKTRKENTKRSRGRYFIQLKFE